MTTKTVPKGHCPPSPERMQAFAAARRALDDAEREGRGFALLVDQEEDVRYSGSCTVIMMAEFAQTLMQAAKLSITKEPVQ